MDGKIPRRRGLAPPRPLVVYASRLWAVSVLTFAAGCAGLPASAKEQLTQAYSQYTDEDYRAAAAILDAILNEYPRHHESAEGYYLRALCNTRQSMKERATADVLACIRYSKQKDQTGKAHAMAGTLLLEAGRTSTAARHYAMALQALPEAPPADLVRYRYGLCLQREGRWREAKLQFAAVYQKYPASDLADDARRIYRWNHDYFTIQCGAFRERVGATTHMKTLKEAGLRARVETQPRSSRLLYMVYVGQYPKYYLAERALRTVRRQAADALIVPRG